MRIAVNIIFCILVCIASLFLYLRLYPKQSITYLPNLAGTPLESLVKVPAVAVVQREIQEVQKAPIQPPQTGAFLGLSLYDYSDTNLLSLEQLVNKHFAIIGKYQSWGETNNTFDGLWAQTISRNGSVPLLTWEPWVPVAGYDRSEDKVDQKDFRLVRIANGHFDTYIRKFASDIKAYKKHIMLRFAHEMNGNWYPWGSTFNTPDEYISAWRHVHDIFRQERAINVSWVWSPNEIYVDSHVPSADRILNFYPGDAYVDWVGFSSFNWAGRYKKNLWREPETMYTETVTTLALLNKPILITETASADAETDNKKAYWIRSLDAYIKKSPLVKGVIWFNAEDNGIDWRIDSTLRSQEAFKNSFDQYFIQYFRE